MKILVIGAGPLGSLFAARLTQGGQEVSLLARGKRLEELRQYGIVLVDAMTGEETVTQVPLVEALGEQDTYDLALVILRKNQAAGTLPALQANMHIPSIVFMMNNAAGPGEFIQALGRERVLLGFPASAGSRDGHKVRVLAGSAERIVAIPFGEVDGRITARTRQVAAVFDSMPGYKAEIRQDMDAWLKTHVALLMPALAAALYGCGVDLPRMARTRDALVLAVRGVRECFQVLKRLGVPIVPASIRQFTWMPEPLLVSFMRKLLARPQMETALAAHANAARDEVAHLAGEFQRLRDQSGVKTPVCDQLAAYFNPAAPLFPDGSAAIPLDYRSLVAAGLVAAALAGLSWWLICGIKQQRG